MPRWTKAFFAEPRSRSTTSAPAGSSLKKDSLRPPEARNAQDSHTNPTHLRLLFWSMGAVLVVYAMGMFDGGLKQLVADLNDIF
jgi:hypothetical protein